MAEWLAPPAADAMVRASTSELTPLPGSAREIAPGARAAPMVVRADARADLVADQLRRRSNFGGHDWERRAHRLDKRDAERLRRVIRLTEHVARVQDR